MPMPKRKIIKVPKTVSADTIVSNLQSVPKRVSRRNMILIAIFILLAILWKFKSSFIVAMVNGQPISRWQLNDRLMKKFGDQTLDSIINERLILAAARQKGIFVKSEEIESRSKQIEQRLNGKISLDDALKAQGLTRDDFKKELEIQVSIEKLFDKDATVAAVDVENYIKNNSQAFARATDPAQVTEEVKTILRQQKVNDLFETWFNDIKKSTKVTKFL